METKLFCGLVDLKTNLMDIYSKWIFSVPDLGYTAIYKF